MIRVRKNGMEIQVKDFHVNLFLRNGFEVVEDKPKEEPKPVAPKKTTTRRTKKQ